MAAKNPVIISILKCIKFIIESVINILEGVQN